LEPVPGTISGGVTDTAGKGLRHIQVQLIDASGTVAAKQFTNAQGNYGFKIRVDGAYVVREVTPRKFVQLSPTFSSSAPTGALVPGATGSSWNYKSGNNDPSNGLPVGPAHWNTIAPAGNLPFESPINITGPTSDLSQVLTLNYDSSVPKAEVNTGAQIQVQIPSGTSDTITLNGHTFSLTQFHNHDPAENTVDGTIYPMEEHFVNVSYSGAETVLGVYLQLGAHNAALDPILNTALTYLDKTPASTSTPGSSVGTIDFAGLLPTSMMGWYFAGSLTTPPLSQVVNWLEFATPITLDATQLAVYQQVANDDGFLPNARPVQPTDGRQLNEIDFDVNFQGTSIGALNFVDAAAGATKAALHRAAHANTAADASASSAGG
jgi:carbonic anhydrase